MNWEIQALVVICFGLIHFLEFSSFLSRISGIKQGSKVTGYTLQQSAFVLTRFFFVAMMPLIGLVVDFGVDRRHYLWMVSCSLFVATLSYLIVGLFSGIIVEKFCSIIERYGETSRLFPAIVYGLFAAQTIASPMLIKQAFLSLRNPDCRKIALSGAVVFGSYSVGVFFSFYAALIFYDHRAAIGQLSGVINALATVMLTFYIEPKISMAIDRNDINAVPKILSLLVGRFFGVAVFAQVAVAIVYFSSI